MEHYASRYIACDKPKERLQLANDFFTYLYKSDYIDEPIAFPVGSHIDSVDVNVLYYIAEWHYGEGDYQQAIDLLTRAKHRFGQVDDLSKSDVYALMGAAYFRMSAYDKAAEALNYCYLLDKKTGDYDRLSSTLNSIASVFTAAGKPQEAQKYIREAIAANSLTDNLAKRAMLFGTASEISRAMDNPQASLDYAQKALYTERLTGDTARLGVRLSQLASAQLSLSKIAEARRSLAEAIPLLRKSGNLHSWGICQNQLGDILASEDKLDEAATCYTDAAMLFMKQGDKYNEMHAREGLYRSKKTSAPDEAMMHLERAKLLQDSIYQQETSDAISHYNALYFNDILQKEKQQAEQRNRFMLIAFGFILALVLMLITTGIIFTLRRHWRRKKAYEQDITSLQDQYDAISRQYQNMVTGMMQESEGLAEGDKAFLEKLTATISTTAELGAPDINTICTQMRISINTLRRRLSQTLDTTPKAYILKVRMNKAKYLLQNDHELSITDVAYRCGYAQVPNFTRAFKGFFGIMPSELRKNETVK